VIDRHSVIAACTEASFYQGIRIRQNSLGGETAPVVRPIIPTHRGKLRECPLSLDGLGCGAKDKRQRENNQPPAGRGSVVRAAQRYLRHPTHPHTSTAAMVRGPIEC